MLGRLEVRASNSTAKHTAPKHCSHGPHHRLETREWESKVLLPYQLASPMSHSILSELNVRGGNYHED